MPIMLVLALVFWSGKESRVYACIRMLGERLPKVRTSLTLEGPHLKGSKHQNRSLPYNHFDSLWLDASCLCEWRTNSLALCAETCLCHYYLAGASDCGAMRGSVSGGPPLHSAMVWY